MTYTARDCDIYLGNDLFAQVPARTRLNPGNVADKHSLRMAGFIADACNDHAQLKREVAHACDIMSGLLGYIELENLQFDSGFKHLARAFLVKNEVKK